MKVKLGVLTRIRTGKLDANAASDDGEYPFFTCSRQPLKINSYSYDCECVLVAGNGDLNVKYYNGKFDAYQRTYIIEAKQSNNLYIPYLYYFMERYVLELRKKSIGGVIKYIKLENLTEATLELPTYEAQLSIVELLRKVQTVIKKRKNQLNKLDELIKARFVEMFGDFKCNPYHFPIVQLKEVASDIFAGGDKPKDTVDCPDDLHPHPIYANGEHNEGLQGYSAHCRVKDDAITVSARGTIGYTCIRKAGFTPVVRLVTLIPNEKINLVFLKYALNIIGIRSSGAVQAQLTVPDFKANSLYLPPMSSQIAFAAFVEEVDKSKIAVQKSLEKAQLLYDSLMQQYFD